MTTTLEIEPPTLANQPALYLKKGNRLQLVTAEQCSVIRNIYNDGRGASEIRSDIHLHDSTGKRIGYVSYNGRVWIGDPKSKSMYELVEVPQRGVKTSAQCQSERWGK